ncbi:MAG: c-type cytochrome [Pseudomonadota bacterium]
MRGLHVITSLALVLSLAGCGSGGGDADAPAEPAAGPAAAAAGPSLASAPKAFGQCAACHSLKPGAHGVGPSLFGIYGTKAGDVPGYTFSPALKASGLTWDDATLDKWIAAPMEVVPGTRMVYPGMADAAKRQELIAFLKTLK